MTEWDGTERRERQQRSSCRTCPLTQEGYCDAHQLEVSQRKGMRSVAMWGIGTIGATLALFVSITMPYLSSAVAAINGVKTDVRVLSAQVEIWNNRTAERLDSQRARMDRIEGINEHRTPAARAP